MRGSARWEIYRAFDRGRETGGDDVARAMEDAHDGLEGSRRVRERAGCRKKVSPSAREERRAAVIERGEGGDRGWMRWMEVFTMGDARARMGED